VRKTDGSGEESWVPGGARGSFFDGKAHENRENPWEALGRGLPRRLPWTGDRLEDREGYAARQAVNIIKAYHISKAVSIFEIWKIYTKVGTKIRR
jgi:hypothetical protein